MGISCLPHLSKTNPDKSCHGYCLTLQVHLGMCLIELLQFWEVDALDV